MDNKFPDINFLEVRKFNLSQYKKDIEILYKSFNQFYLDNDYNIYLDKKENEEINFSNMIEEDFSHENSLSFIAYKGGAPIAYILGYTQNLSEYFVTGRVCYIDGLFVESSCRGLGLGEKLIELFTEKMKNEFSVHIVRLDVKTKNSNAIAVYEKNGFAPDAQRMYKVI